MTRQFSTELLTMIDEGTLDARAVAHACLVYMSESDVQDMAESEGFVEVEDEEPEEEPEDDIDDDSYDEFQGTIFDDSDDSNFFDNDQ
jgi:hypothetical protein